MVYSGAYGLVLLRLSELPDLPDNRVVVDRDNRLVALKKGEEILVVQSLDLDFFNLIAEASEADPSYLVELFERLESACVVPWHISFMRVATSDLERIRVLRSRGR